VALAERPGGLGLCMAATALIMPTPAKVPIKTLVDLLTLMALSSGCLTLWEPW